MVSTDAERIVKQIEMGESKLERMESIKDTLAKKLRRYETVAVHLLSLAAPVVAVGGNVALRRTQNVVVVE